jgi:hypothetical protein
LLRLGDGQFAGREVVQKEQGFRSAHCNVVDAHSDEVDADRVVAVHQEGDLQFSADAIGTGYQHRIFILFALKTEQAAKAPEIR